MRKIKAKQIRKSLYSFIQKDLGDASAETAFQTSEFKKRYRKAKKDYARGKALKFPLI